MFGLVREQYTAPAENCRLAWVSMPDAASLFEVPDLGTAQLAAEAS